MRNCNHSVLVGRAMARPTNISVNYHNQMNMIRHNHEQRNLCVQGVCLFDTIESPRPP
ncbi:MAG: hypothetical protein J5701_06915 [Bacteroidales bacterium]|nr:hypothetical protein [Bacteroidales bacterium]